MGTTHKRKLFFSVELLDIFAHVFFFFFFFVAPGGQIIQQPVQIQAVGAQQVRFTLGVVHLTLVVELIVIYSELFAVDEPMLFLNILHFAAVV